MGILLLGGATASSLSSESLSVSLKNIGPFFKNRPKRMQWNKTLKNEDASDHPSCDTLLSRN